MAVYVSMVELRAQPSLLLYVCTADGRMFRVCLVPPHTYLLNRCSNLLSCISYVNMRSLHVSRGRFVIYMTCCCRTLYINQHCRGFTCSASDPCRCCDTFSVLYCPVISLDVCATRTLICCPFYDRSPFRWLTCAPLSHIPQHTYIVNHHCFVIFHISRTALLAVHQPMCVS